MSGPEQIAMPLERLLAEAGWMQGSLFVAPSVSFAYNDLEQSPEGNPISVKTVRVPPDSKLVVVTQTCDIVARSNVEPCVEAMACIDADQARVRSWDRNSARYFPIDPESGLVASAQSRLQVSKQVLATLTPMPWPSGSDRYNRFVRWLARRYDRPAIPDVLVNNLQSPIQNVLRQIDKRSPDTGDAFNHAVYEVRALLPRNEHPPFDVQLILLVTGDSLGQEEANAIDAFWDKVLEVTDPSIIRLSPRRIVSPDKLSVRDYEESTALYLDYMTHRGEDTVGVGPLNMD